MSSRALFFFVAGALGALLLSAPQFAEAAPAKCVPRTFWTDYMCQSEGTCGAGTLQRSCNNCGCGGWNQHQAGQVSRICPAGRGIQRSPIGLACTGKCYIPPNPKPLNDPSLSPQNVFGEDGAAKLPVNIGWDEAAEQQIVSKDACELPSYHYQVLNGQGSPAFEKRVSALASPCGTAGISDCKSAFDIAKTNNDGAGMNRAHAIADAIRGFITDSLGERTINKNAPSPNNPTFHYLTGEYDFVFDKNQDVRQDIARYPSQACFLRPSSSYAFRVRSCIDARGNDCGTAWSNAQSFATNAAPELISPFDQDFEGPKKATPDLPVTLSWCALNATDRFQLEFDREVKIEIPEGEDSYSDEKGMQAFYKALGRTWKIFACTTGLRSCAAPSQEWSFAPKGNLRIPSVVSSGAEQVVNRRSMLEWDAVSYARFFLVRVQRESQNLSFFVKAVDVGQLPMSDVWESLRYDTVYSWKVAPCWGNAPDESQCEKTEGKTAWSPAATFRTTGAAPNLRPSLPLPDGTVTIPMRFSWDPIPGALSYRYELSEDSGFKSRVAGGFVADPAVSFPYEDQGGAPLEIERTYHVRVSSCADTDGQACSDIWARREARTSLPPAPTSPAPSRGEAAELPWVTLKWEASNGGNFYEYAVTYEKPLDASRPCSNNPPGKEVRREIVSEAATPPFNPVCSGHYTASVTPCVESSCALRGAPLTWSFTVQEKPSGIFAGLVPCGRGSDNPRTPWAETERCELRHAFLLGKSLLDFLLYSATPTLIILFALYTGIIAYFSFGTSDMLSKIKGIWRAVGIGLLIMFFSWMFMNLLLGILGFNVNIFGRWYEIR